ncbi:MAG: cobyrinate a,c-diamide synthase [Bacilli bacterium]
MKRSRIVIAGVSSGAGKTTVTLGVMAALRRRGLSVQGFKVGPDFIDPSYHSAVTGRLSRNLDSWMMEHAVVREVFERGGEGADISVIEGVMGMYDGKEPLSNTGSTAEVSLLLHAPVILVVNVSSMARSAAAVVLGFQQLDPAVRVAGVIVNRVGSVGHYELVKAAIEQVCAIPVVGYLARHDDLQIPERHLGLIPALERGELTPLFDALAAAVEETVELDRILQLAQASSRWEAAAPQLFVGAPQAPTVTIAVARDSAFNFYYPENLELLSWYGAAIRYFKPLMGERIPDDADGLYIGGGFPEEFAAELSAQTHVLANVRERIRAGLPTFAECGGFMFLSESIVDRCGAPHPMVGVIPAAIRMQTRLAALGYREVRALASSPLLARGELIKGHEFHYSTVTYHGAPTPHAYETAGLRGSKQEGYVDRSLVAGYTHLHFASNVSAVKNFIASCEAYRTEGKRAP